MICYVLAMGKQHRTWLWDTALKLFGRAFSLRHQITWMVIFSGKYATCVGDLKAPGSGGMLPLP